MQLIKSVLIAAALTVSTPVFADNPPPVNNAGAADYLYDVVLRPAGFVATILGSALYLALTPATAITSIYPPHDTFEKFAELVIVNPYEFTFSRSVGDYNFWTDRNIIAKAEGGV